MTSILGEDPRKPDALVQAVGRVAIESAAMESMLGALYEALLGSERARVVVIGQSFDTVRQACVAILERVLRTPASDELVDETIGALRTARELYGRRSNVVHAVLIPNGSRTVWHRGVAKRWQTKYAFDELQVDDVHALGDALADQRQRLFELAKRWAD